MKLHSVGAAACFILLASSTFAQGNLGGPPRPDGTCLAGENINGICLYCGGIGEPVCPSMHGVCSDRSSGFNLVFLNGPRPGWYCMRNQPQDRTIGYCGFQGMPACEGTIVPCQTGFFESGFCIACGEVGEPCRISPSKELRCAPEATCTREPRDYVIGRIETLNDRGICVPNKPDQNPTPGTIEFNAPKARACRSSRMADGCAAATCARTATKGRIRNVEKSGIGLHLVQIFLPGI